MPPRSYLHLIRFSTRQRWNTGFVGRDEPHEIQLLERLRDHFRAAADQGDRGAEDIVKAAEQLLEEKRSTGRERNGASSE
jgi:hypothetical protein